MQYFIPYLLILLLVACNHPNPEHQDKPKDNSSQNIVIPTVSTNCKNKPNITFDRTIRAGKNSYGYVRIRSSNSFSQGNLDNIIGKVKSGKVIYAHLPEEFRAIVDEGVPSTKNPYYVIRVRDKNGVDCIGYIAGWTLG